MGRPRCHGRDINGVLLLDKPQGCSSNEVLQQVKRLFNANKAGHTGALDPLATGMLPICLGEATKFSQFLLDADKRYRVVAQLGQRTTTSDADGEVVSIRDITFTQTALMAALQRFRGQIQQIPSLYSALKYRGKPLYEYARQGLEVPREARDIIIYGLQLVRWEGNKLELMVHCSKGTYIRTIIDDLGEILGCGAHVIYLRRIQVSHYSAEQMVTLAQLQQMQSDAQEQALDPRMVLDSLLLPMDSSVSSLLEINLSTVVGSYFLQGQSVQAIGLPGSGLVRISIGETRRFIGVGEVDKQGRVAPRRLIVAERAPV